MDRRKALLALMAATIGGFMRSIKPVRASDELSIDTDLTFALEPMDIMFGEDYIRNVIIKRKDKPDIVIPFSEIIEELSDFGK